MINEIFDIIFRSISSIVVLFIMTLLMGKKQIAQLTFFDYVIGISIGSLASEFSVNKEISYLRGLISIIIFGILPIIVSHITLKSMNGRRFLGGVPTILIQDGKIMEHSLVKTKLNINDILEECRLKGAFNISDVEFAILETNGKVSIKLKPHKQPITCKDMNIKVESDGLPANLIIDGKIIYQHLQMVGHDQKWLVNELKKRKIKSSKDVLLATLDKNNNLYIDLKDNDYRPFKVLD